jgi:hypothetical protein
LINLIIFAMVDLPVPVAPARPISFVFIE